MFNGDMDQAAAMYRLADAGYGTQGPYRGLELVNCLVQRGRSLEAFDASRRALATMPPEEALAHLPRFNQLRLAGLREWRQRDPANPQVQRWLDFYEADAAEVHETTEALSSAPTPQVALELDLGGGRSLIGFDYRGEDIETGPYMQVDFYVREGRDAETQYTRIRRNVLNQAINGAFRWDAVPAGVRPAGWHQFVYSPNLAGLYPEAVTPGQHWLCLDAGRVGSSFGLESDSTPLSTKREAHIQGGSAFLDGDGSLSIERTWSGTQDPHNYSPVGGRPQPNTTLDLVGSWIPKASADTVAVWIISHQTTKACFKGLYLFAIPF
jgi:hypothetical protein